MLINLWIDLNLLNLMILLSKIDKIKNLRRIVNIKNMNKDSLIFSGNGNIEFANKVVSHLNMELSKCDLMKFANGEIGVTITNSVRRKNCYIIQSTAISEINSPNDNLMELFIMIDALRRGSANEINIILPYYAYSRQDRKDYSRAPISASIISQFLSCLNVNRIIVYDLHAGQIGGFFPNNIPLDNLYVEPYFIDCINKMNYSLDDIVIVAPDEGAYKRAVRISSTLGCGCASIYKERKVANKIETMSLFGEVDGKIAILVDDIIDTAGTACAAANTLADANAKKVYMFACHGLLSNDAVGKINRSRFDKIFITNTVYIPEKVMKNDKIEILDVSKLCAEVLIRIQNGDSLSSLYNDPLLFL